LLITPVVNAGYRKGFAQTIFTGLSVSEKEGIRAEQTVIVECLYYRHLLGLSGVVNCRRN
jgi:hypothetical protein